MHLFANLNLFTVSLLQFRRDLAKAPSAGPISALRMAIGMGNRKLKYGRCLFLFPNQVVLFIATLFDAEYLAYIFFY